MVLLALIVTVAAVLRSAWLAQRVAQAVSKQVREATGMLVRYQRVGFSLRSFAVRIEDIDLWRPGKARLLHVRALEVAVTPSALVRGDVTLSQVTLDGGSLSLEFRTLESGQTVLDNGPVTQASQGAAEGPSELPFRDVAVSDLRVRIEHPEVGLDLGPLDLDAVNAGQGQLMLGLLVPQGRVRSRFYTGVLRRLETRLAVNTRTGDLRLAFAQVLTPRLQLMLREARYAPATGEVEGHLRAEVQAEDVTGAIRKVSTAVPYFEGHVGLDLTARANLQRQQFQLRGTVDAVGFGLRAPDSSTSESLRYNLADSGHLRIEGDEHGLVARDVRIGFAGSTLVSDRVEVGLDHVPAVPALRGLAAMPRRAGGPGIAGNFRIDGLDFTRLMNDVTITPRTIVMWNLSGDVRFRGTFDPIQLSVDMPEIESRDFALLKTYFTVLPQEPIVRIARARLDGRMDINDTSISWNDINLSFGQSRAHVDRVRVMTTVDRRPIANRERDLRIENLQIERLHLADLGTVADLPIAGEATGTASMNDDMGDPLLTGTARIDNFVLATFPFGSIEPFRWRMRSLRLDAEAGTVIRGRHRDSGYVLSAPFLDFSQYTMAAGAHVSAERAVLYDVLHMFHFENDPVFTPYAGTGRVEADVSYLLGRRGDDRDGVMRVDATLRDAQFTAFDEHVADGEARLRYDWLVRRQGVRGARASVEAFRGCKGSRARYDAAHRFLGCQNGVGELFAAGGLDLGGRMHFSATARDIPMSSIDMVRASNAPVQGTMSSVVTVEGEPDALRFTVDNSFRNLVALGRPIGAMRMHYTQTPEEEERPRRDGERPPLTRMDVELALLEGRLRAQSTVRTPFREQRWRDALGVDHTSYERDWPRSLVSGSLEATEAIDILPWLPPATLAQLGENPSGRARFRVDVARARLGEMTRADGSLRVDVLDLRAHNTPLSLAQSTAFASCFRDGAVWIVPTPASPAGASVPVACGDIPGALQRGVLGGASAGGVAFDPARPLFVGPEGTRLWLGGGVRVTPSAGGGPMQLRYDVTARGELDLARVATRVPSLSWGRGTGLLQVRATGDTERIDLGGSVVLENGALGVIGLDTPISNLDLDVQLSGNSAYFRRARAQYGAASVDLSRGEVRFAGPHLERADVPITVRGFSLAPMEGAEVGVDADARMVWEPGGELPVLRGDVNITRARYVRPMSFSMDLSGRLRGTGAEAPPTPYNPANDHVRLDLTVRTTAPMRVSNNLADVDLRIGTDRPFRVMGTDQRTGVVGTIELPRGNLRLYDTDFELRSGRIDFDNPDRIAPNFDLAAQTDIRRTGDSNRSQWRVRLHAYGNPERFAFDMNAEPTLSREDIVLLLLFRLTRAELERIGGANAGQAVGIEFLALTTGIDRAVRNAIPVIDDFRLGSAYNPRTNRTEPLVSAGRQVVDWFRIGGGFTLSDQPLGRATGDVRLGERLGVQLLFENASNGIGAQSANVGADLRWRLEFQ